MEDKKAMEVLSGMARVNAYLSNSYMSRGEYHRPTPENYCCGQLMNQASKKKWKCRVCGKFKKIINK